MTILAAGFLVGVLFGVLDLEPPVPESWEGALAVVGVVAGWRMTVWYSAEFLSSATGQVLTDWFGRLLP